MLIFGTFIGRFPSDGAANMTVKGLTLTKKSAFLGRKHDSERVNTDKKIGISGAQT